MPECLPSKDVWPFPVHPRQVRHDGRRGDEPETANADRKDQQRWNTRKNRPDGWPPLSVEYNHHAPSAPPEQCRQAGGREGRRSPSRAMKERTNTATRASRREIVKGAWRIPAHRDDNRRRTKNRKARRRALQNNTVSSRRLQNERDGLRRARGRREKEWSEADRIAAVATKPAAKPHQRAARAALGAGRVGADRIRKVRRCAPANLRPLRGLVAERLDAAASPRPPSSSD